MKIVDVMETVFQVRTFKNKINAINKLLPNFGEYNAVDIAVRSWDCIKISAMVEDAGRPIAT